MKHKGFTLIELLVVIAIIAILAAILFPVFAQAKAAAKTTGTISNQKQVGMSVHMYASDYDDMTSLIEGSGTNGRMPASLRPYIKNIPVWWDVTTGMAPVTIDDTDDWSYWPNLSANAWGMFGYWVFPASGSTYVPGRSMSSQEDISQRCMFASAGYPGFEIDGWGYYQFVNQDAAYPARTGLEADFWRDLIWISARRHRDGVIVSYADGHSGRVPAGKIFLPLTAPDPTAYDKKFWGTYSSATQ